MILANYLVLRQTSLGWRNYYILLFFLHDWYWLWFNIRYFWRKFLSNLFLFYWSFWLHYRYWNCFRSLGLLFSRMVQFWRFIYKLIVFPYTLVNNRFLVFLIFFIYDVICVFKKSLSFNQIRSFEPHHLHWLAIKLHQLFFHVGVLFWVDLLLYFYEFLSFVWFLLFVVVWPVGIFSVDD